MKTSIINIAQQELTTHNMVQGSSEWLEKRRGMITASHFSEVLCKGAGRKTYMFRLIGERLSGELCPSFSSKAMEWGIETEPQAREYYESLYGEVQQVGFIQRNEWVGASPDGLFGDDGSIEIKCPYSATHIQYIIKGKLPAIYKPQVQGQLGVMNRQWCDFISFDPRVKSRPFWKIRVYRDDEYIKNLSNAVDKFIVEMQEYMGKITNNNLDFLRGE